MKTKNSFITSVVMIILAMVSLSSCVSTYPLVDSSYYAEPVYTSVSNTATPVYYQGRNYTASGVKIIGDRNCPIGLIMADMRIVRNGLIVTVTDGTGKNILKQYDLRVRNQDVEDIFHATSLNGVPIEVVIVVRGSSGRNSVTIKDGAHSNSFRLRRN